MRDPFTDPFCKPDDLGLAIPDSDHAVSVCLPQWKHVIGYEEGEQDIIDQFECGYPRFVIHPIVAELCLAAREEFAKDTEAVLVFPSLAAAWRCADYVKQRTGSSCRLESYGWNSLIVVLFPEECFDVAWKCWQHGGEIVSSRLAESALSDAPLNEKLAEEGSEALNTIRERLASFHEGVSASDVFLFSSGMAAIFALHRIATRRKPGKPTLQLEFPYLDTFKIQQQFGEGGVVDFSVTASGGEEEIREWFEENGDAAAVFSEIPSNPLLRTANLKGISPLLRERDIPLIVDDTIATSVNVDGFRYADAITTSLTKVFSGEGDVAAGAVILNPKSPFYEEFLDELPSEESGGPLFERDAIALEVNSRHFEERVRASDENTLEIVQWLREQPQIEKLWFPDQETESFYRDLMREDGAYGGLFSVVLRGGESAAAAFYDKLEMSKGPSLGTNFSLACPYTLLAHYKELEWASERGVDRNLLRFWIGLEDPDELKERFQKAFS
ncbi:MAG: hypothetical protein CMO55_15330 [Verrucomicrobiales bacterium]|nr:hypothetical protein [Verrucomicrobiales bacterium]